MELLWNLFKSLRPKQWIKNLFLFAPLVFSFRFLEIDLLLKTVIAFFSFCLVSGFVYIMNDIVDLKKDRLHPEKKNRPIASGKVSTRAALLFAVLMLAVNVPLLAFLNLEFGMILVFYLFLNLCYSFVLKKIAVVDIMVIALGFVLRIMAGGVVDLIDVSDWILITTFLLALFLALVKRRQEFVRFREALHNTRKTLSHYSLQLIDQMIAVTTAATIMTYILYTMSEEIKIKYGQIRLFYTVPFVIFGLFRYLYLVYVRELGENPSDVIFRDPIFTANIILWLCSFIGLVLPHIKN